MAWLSDLRPFRLFELYLTLMFLVSTYLRVRQYRTVVGLVRNFPGRWPRLLEMVKQHGNLFLTKGTVLPLAVSLGLVVVQSVANHWVWPQADRFTGGDLAAVWPALPLMLLGGAAMVAFDAYGTWNVGEIDRAELEKYFDQAEYWLRSRAAPVVRVFTLGYVNPRKMVAVEVRSALESASKLLNTTLWWVSVQAGLRILFGLTLWGTYALEPWARQVLGT